MPLLEGLRRISERPRKIELYKGQIELYKNSNKYSNSVYTLPKHLDEKVAKLHLDKVGAKLTKLSDKQANYLGVKQAGPFKGDSYRY